MKNKYDMLGMNLAILLFSLAELFAKAIALPALTITFGRVLFSSITLFIVAMCFKVSLNVKNRKHVLYFILAGIILSLHWWSFLYAIQLSSVAIGTITFSTFPLFVTILAALFLKERWHKKQMIMCLLIIVGVMMTVPSALTFHDHLIQGIITGLFSALTYAILTLFNKYFSKQYSGITISFYEQACSTIILLPAIFLKTAPIRLYDLQMLIILGILCTALAHTLFISSLKNISSHIAGMISALESVYSIILAIIFFQEIPSLKEIAGALIITVTVICCQFMESGGNENGT